MQEKQIDAHVRFWNDQTNQVTTRYSWWVLGLLLWTSYNIVSSFTFCADFYVFTKTWLQIWLFTVNLGHGNAENLMEHFIKSVLESGLQAKNIIQVSMDWQSVNWTFYEELKK